MKIKIIKVKKKYLKKYEFKIKILILSIKRISRYDLFPLKMIDIIIIIVR